MLKAFNSQLEKALGATASRRHRLIVHIAEEEQCAVEIVQHLLDVTEAEEALWIDHLLKQPVKTLQNLLGSEIDAIVLNAYAGLNPNVLGMCQGLVRAGGLFILVTPKASQWPFFDDPDYARFESDDCASQRQKGFIRHTLNALSQIPIVRIDANQVDISPELFKKGNEQLFIARFKEQQQLVEAIKQTAKGRARQPLVIKADRGRGKSSAMGLAAKDLLKSDKSMRIGVCALSRQSVDMLFNHASEFGSVIQFYPPDKLIEQQPELDLLFVDEAASIPVSLLKKITEHYKRIIFATTVQGYEGSGQGFELRFQPYLTKHYPRWKNLSLVKPIRYGMNDPLERFVDRVLMLNLSVRQDHKSVATANIRLRWVSAEELVQDQDFFTEVTSLLMTAHYQTSPDDIRLLLDHPALKLAVAENESLLAVAVLFEEGVFSETLQASFQQAPRRLKGHILPQQLNTMGFAQALPLRFWRVSRIAVNSYVRRQGVGQGLLNFIYLKATAAKVDSVGTVFSLEAENLLFWQRSGYQIVHVGSKPNTASGQHSGMLLKALTPEGLSLLEQARSQFFRQLDFQLLTQTHIDVQLLPLFFKGIKTSVGEHDKQLVKSYLAKRVDRHQARFAMRQMLVAMLDDDITEFSLAKNSLVLLYLLQGMSDKNLTKRNTGWTKKTIDKEVREFFTQFIT